MLSIAGVLGMALLSSALRDLTFQPPVPFTLDFAPVAPIPPTIISVGSAIPVWRYFLFAVALLFILAVIVFLLDPELRKNVLKRLAQVAVTVVVVWWVMSKAVDHSALKPLLDGDQEAAGGAAAVTKQTVPPVYIPPHINPWLIFAVSFAIGLALVLFAWFVYTRRPKPSASGDLQEVAAIARQALIELEPGRNWDESILRAYIRMNEVVFAQRGLVRQPANTPAEFALRMEQMGLPPEAVRSLTNLFEGVRYGGLTSSKVERDLAASALSAILHYCGQTE